MSLWTPSPPTDSTFAVTLKIGAPQDVTFTLMIARSGGNTGTRP